MPLRAAVGLVLCAALTASAQPATDAGAPGAAASQAPAAPTPEVPSGTGAALPAGGGAEAPPAATSREELQAFLEQYLAFDERTGEAYAGRARQPLTRTQLYTLLERPDLQEQTDTRSRTRTLLFAGAAASLAVGLGTGLYLYSTLPDLTQGDCTAGPMTYNTVCSPRHYAQSTAAGGLIAAGVGVALALSLGALNYDLHPVPRAEVSRLVGAYNGALRKRLSGGRGVSSAPSAQLRVAPALGPQGAGLAASLTF